MTQRDTRHANYDPADYTVLGVFDSAPEQGGIWLALDESVMGDGFGRWGSPVATDEFEAEVSEVERRCAHCGRRFGFRFEAYVRHLPSGELLFFGSGCVADAYAMDRAALKAIEYGKAAELQAKRDAWTEANPEQAAALDRYEEMERENENAYDAFLADLSRARRLYGALTEGQTPWPTKALEKLEARLARIAEREAALAEAPALTEGRYRIEGVVRSQKYQDSDFGTTLKMLVELADGNRVWGTVPSALEGRIEVGDKVAFDAAVERSAKDDHFGFYKRPTKPEVLEEAS